MGYKIIITGLLLGFTLNVQAKSMPRSCTNDFINVNSQQLILNNQTKNPKTRLFLVYNKSPKTIKVYQPNDNYFMGNHYEINLKRHQWAAISVSQNDLNLKCDADCASTLSICHFPKVKFDLSNKGTYWIGQHRSLYNVYRQARKKGIWIAY